MRHAAAIAATIRCVRMSPPVNYGRKRRVKITRSERKCGRCYDSGEGPGDWATYQLRRCSETAESVTLRHGHEGFGVKSAGRAFSFERARVMLAGLLGDLRTTMTAGAAARPREALIARYESYLEHDPHNEALLVALGDLHHESKAFEKALEFYRRCLARNPAHLGAQSRMANVLISQHRFAEAQAMLEALRATYPDEPGLCFNLGLTQYYQRHWSDALDALDNARERGLQDA